MLTVALILAVAALSVGINATLWSVAGCARWLADRKRPASSSSSLTREQVAILCAARNEASVIEGMLATAGRLVAMGQVHVVSDASTDRTAGLARLAGASVLELGQNVGKASALVAGIARFELCRRYEVVLILDADTELSEDYLDTGLPLFDDPDVAAVAAMAHTMWRPSETSRIGRMLMSYRERFYLYTQHMFKYGQGWARADAVTVAPGFASMYRAGVLEKLPIAAAGLVIEDFNMTFETHRQRLGRIAFHPGAAIAYTQDPDNFTDYRKQVGRWALGYWQSVRRFLRRPGRFEFFLTLLSVEIAVSCVIFVLAPLVMLVWGLAVVTSWLGAGADSIAGQVVRTGIPIRLAVAVLALDLLMSLAAAVCQRRMAYLKWALIFPLLRVVDAWLGLRGLVQAFTVRSRGRWISPVRRPTSATSGGPAVTGGAARGAGQWWRTGRRSGVLVVLGLVALLAVLTSAYGKRGHPIAPCSQPSGHAVLASDGRASGEAVREGAAVHNVLAQTPYISRGTPRKREVALTFDDGPGPFTPQVLSVLTRSHVPATFFVVGREVRAFGAYVAAERAGHFVIGNHTEDHQLLPALSPAAQQLQIRQQMTAIRSCGVSDAYLFRPPYGGFNRATLALLRRDGLLMVLWSVDTRDYTRPGVSVIVRRALAGAAPGAIILMHDGDANRNETVAALPRIIAGLRARHLVPVTIPRLLLDDPPSPTQPQPHSLSVPIASHHATRNSAG